MEGTKRVRVNALAEGAPYITRVTARQHTLMVDEPPEDGGGDTAPKPHELLCAALASCTAITIRMYAARKQWPLQAVTVAVTMDRTSAAGQVETALQMDLSFEGDLDQAQRERLQQIAKACPVHRTLENPIHIATDLA
ncbi:MAG: OsmC family protein [Flavobacteriales bacterium]|nr:OsmC family protein [Flavobacteriales bacterium]MCB9168340.1 OsmC family protein [Flavobacteriales bacterium]